MLLKMKLPVLAGVIILFSVFPLFLNISTLPIRLFDESRLANNALEMNRDSNFLIVHYKGEPDMWNTKPPLMIWSQVFFMKIASENELAVRLPAAISGLLTILLIYLFVVKATGLCIYGLLASLALIATRGYIFEHGTRSGDYDSMLVFFLMLQLAAFYLFIKDIAQKKYWYLACLGVILAVYTKGIAGLMLLPGFLLFALFSKKLLPVLRLKETWLGVLISAAFILGYYGLREMYNPGYIHKVIENEITYRYFDVNEGHVGPWNFYLNYLADSGYSVWYLFAIGGVVTAFIQKRTQLQNVVLFTALNAISFLVVISTSETKIEWYALPLFPLLAILTASFFYYLYDVLSMKLSGKMSFLKSVPLIIFAFLFSSNYIQILNYVSKPVELIKAENIYSLGYVLQKAHRGEINLDGIYYCYPSYHAHLHFYTSILARQGQKVTLVDQQKLKPGNKVLAGSRDVQEFIKANYKTEILLEWNGNVQLFLIL